MKKILLAAVFMFAALATQAQSVTQQSILGKWKLIYIEANGVAIDAVKKTYTISDEVKGSMSPEDFEYMQSTIGDMVAQGLEGTVEFTNDVMTEQHTEEGEMLTESGKYIFTAGTPSTIQVSMPNGDKTTLEVTFKDGNLILFEAVENAKVIYTKAK